ncbi:MAG: sugar ABC transporter permease [Clostridia bacterium]|nr:sugar ABC transporter permease [Clostridia bacterium]
MKKTKRPSLLKYTESYLMLGFWFVFFVFFTLIPIGISVVISFTDYNMLQTPHFVGFNNYIRLLLDDEIFVKSLANTLLFAVITGPVGYLISFIIAWFINETGRGIRPFLTVLFYSPSIAGSIYVVWTYIFSDDSYGLLNSTLLNMGILKKPIQWLTDTNYNFYVVIVVILWMSMGTSFLAFIAGLQSLNKSLFESAAIDGIRNRWQELWYITLPQMVPQLLIGAVLTISTSFAVGAVPAALTGNPSTDYSTHTLILHIEDYGNTRLEMGYASSAAVILFIIMVATWFVINKGVRSLGKD